MALPLLYIGVVILGTFFLLRYLLEKMRLKDWTEKFVLITGCDTGFGHDLAIKCISEGMPVFACCFGDQGIEKLKVKTNSLSGKLMPIKLDVRCQKSVDNALNAVEKLLNGRHLHGLVNNAGISANGAHDDWLTLADYEEALNVNTYGVIRVTHAFKHLIKQSRGRITMIASMCSRFPMVGVGPYVVSKSALTGYCDVLRQEMRQFDVKVCLLEPGFFKTQLTNVPAIENKMNLVWDRVPQKVRDEYGEDYYQNAKSLSMMVLDSLVSERTDYVVDAYFHSLTARFPRTRYHVGYDAQFWFIPMSFLPSDIQDFVNWLHMKVLRAPVPAVLKQTK